MKLSRVLRKEAIKDIAIDLLELCDADVKNLTSKCTEPREFIFEVLMIWRTRKEGTKKMLTDILQRAASHVIISSEALDILK